jgi:hypothetical protein
MYNVLNLHLLSLKEKKHNKIGVHVCGENIVQFDIVKWNLRTCTYDSWSCKFLATKREQDSHCVGNCYMIL